MDKNHTNFSRRSEHRDLNDQYDSVQFTKQELSILYQFKIWNVSRKGMCILVREDSNVLKHLHVGDILDMQFYPLEKSKSIELVKVEIKHMTKEDHGKFKGHYLVGLAILPSK